MYKIANISHDFFVSYTGTAIPTDYKFVCWVGDANEDELIITESDKCREIIQIPIPFED